MKKVVLFLLFALVCIGTVCAVDEYKDMQQAPSLDVPGAVVFDLKPVRKKIEDNIAFVNMTETDIINFEVYYIDYNTGEWVKNKNRGRVEGYNDRDIVELDKKLVIVQKKIGGEVKDVEVWRPTNIKKVPFIAIVPKPADDYKNRTYAQSNDFYIEITK